MPGLLFDFNFVFKRRIGNDGKPDACLHEDVKKILKRLPPQDIKKVRILARKGHDTETGSRVLHTAEDGIFRFVHIDAAFSLLSEEFPGAFTKEIFSYYVVDERGAINFCSSPPSESLFITLDLVMQRLWLEANWAVICGERVALPSESAIQQLDALSALRTRVEVFVDIDDTILDCISINIAREAGQNPGTLLNDRVVALLHNVKRKFPNAVFTFLTARYRNRLFEVDLTEPTSAASVCAKLGENNPSIHVEQTIYTEYLDENGNRASIGFKVDVIEALISQDKENPPNLILYLDDSPKELKAAFSRRFEISGVPFLPIPIVAASCLTPEQVNQVVRAVWEPAQTLVCTEALFVEPAGGDAELEWTWVPIVEDRDDDHDDDDHTQTFTP